MYKTEPLKTQYYMMYKDNLMFNYCMILGAAYYKYKVKFFPIIWREDDQVSNVKMVNQALNVLKLLWIYITNKKAFIEQDHRDAKIIKYSAECIYSKQV